MANLKKKLQRERQRRKKQLPATAMDSWIDKDGLIKMDCVLNQVNQIIAQYH